MDNIFACLLGVSLGSLIGFIFGHALGRKSMWLDYHWSDGQIRVPYFGDKSLSALLTKK